MWSLSDKIGTPVATIKEPEGFAIVWYPEEDENGVVHRNHWLFRLPGPGEFQQLFSALTFIRGLTVDDDGGVSLKFVFEDLSPFPPRITELAMLIIDVQQVGTDFARHIQTIKEMDRAGGASN